MRFLVLPGDGIGPEITRATVAVLDAANARFALGLEYDYADIGFAALEKSRAPRCRTACSTVRGPPTASSSARSRTSTTRRATGAA